MTEFAQYADRCLGPGCLVVMETDEPFHSAQCQQAFQVWARDMDEHLTHWTEVA